MNPEEFFQQIHDENDKKSNDPSFPGHILCTQFEEDTIRDFVNDLYKRLGLKMCPQHLTTKLPSNGYTENWKPSWFNLLNDEDDEDISPPFIIARDIPPFTFTDKMCCCDIKENVSQ